MDDNRGRRHRAAGQGNGGELVRLKQHAVRSLQEEDEDTFADNPLAFSAFFCFCFFSNQ